MQYFRTVFSRRDFTTDIYPLLNNLRGERQLAGYLDDYHIDQGYMVSFNFNKKKKTGVFEVVVGDKILIEAVV